MLNKIVNPIIAPIESQKPESLVKSPFDLRIAFPIVGSLIEMSLFGCNNIERLTLVEMFSPATLGYNGFLVLRINQKYWVMRKTYTGPPTSKEFIDRYCILTVHHRR
jgi:hypothetical protein